MKKLTIIALLMTLSLAAGAQDRNAARLVLEDTTYVDVALGVNGATGPRRKLGKVSLYGHFGYSYEYATGSTWRGWINPLETPFMLADSIPGTLSLERYKMEAGAGLPLDGHWSLGLDLSYDVALMAKHKDLRNKNTFMDFQLSPGIHWRAGGVGLGLNLGYERTTERVEYTQVSSSVEHMLFDIYGLWVAHGSGFASAENRRFKENNRFFGGFQFDVSAGRTVLHNELRASWLQSAQTEVGYNNQQFGTTRSWTWKDDLSLSFGPAHAVEASVSFSTMQGFRPLQRQELDPASRVRVWVTYGVPVFCYWRRSHRESIRYRFGTSWQLVAELSNLGFEHTYTEYPQHFVQRYHTFTPTLAAVIPLGRVRLTPMIGYAMDYDTYSDVTKWQLKEPLLRQWDYWDGNNYLAALDLKWSSASGRCYVEAHYSFESSTRLDDDGVRHGASLTLGFIF